jgi:hypothetical protein
MAELFRRNVLHVEPDTYRHPPQRVALPTCFTQDPSDLFLANHEVVGPFQLYRAWHQVIQSLGYREPDPQAHDLQTSGHPRAKQDAQPQSTRRRMPRTAPGPASPQLFVGNYYRAGFSALASELMENIHSGVHPQKMAELDRHVI